MPARHRERHRMEHSGWLRAAVLGANDGIISTSSLMLGVAAAHGSRGNVLVAGVAGLIAGAMSMAAHAPLRYCLSPGGESAYLRGWNFTALARAFGSIGGAHWRRSYDAERNTRHVLGCTGHGDDRRRRGLVRNISMIMSGTKRGRYI
jgi:VIT family